MFTSSTIYLITGVNKGIGKGLLAAYLSAPNNIVIGTVRDPTHSASQVLTQLPTHPSSTLILVKLESTSEADGKAVIAHLKVGYGITRIGIVIANAGIAKTFPRVVEAEIADMQEHCFVNVIGVVILFKSVLPLLKNSKKQPKFVALGSSAGRLGDVVPFPSAAYGPSKAVLHYITRKIHIENPEIIAFPIDPG